jgi:hypothetical protein
MNVGVDNMEGGGEWPDPDTPPAPGASGWDRDRVLEATPVPDDETSDARIMVDHDEIRRWVEDHGGRPVRARPAGTVADGVPQIDFLRGRGDRSLEPVDWQEWFRMFDDFGLALLLRDGDDERGDRALVEFVRR